MQVAEGPHPENNQWAEAANPLELAKQPGFQLDKAAHPEIQVGGAAACSHKKAVSRPCFTQNGPETPPSVTNGGTSPHTPARQADSGQNPAIVSRGFVAAQRPNSRIPWPPTVFLGFPLVSKLSKNKIKIQNSEFKTQNSEPQFDKLFVQTRKFPPPPLQCGDRGFSAAELSARGVSVL